MILDGEFDAFEWGWYVEPDPDSMLSYMTCGQLGNWSDSWYCNEEYDALYEQQHTEIDDAARVEIVKQMQEMLFEDSPYLVTAYNTIGEACAQRPLRLPAAAAGPGRDLLDPVRRLQLHEHAPGRRGRRLRRAGGRDPGDRRPAAGRRGAAPAC